MLFSSYKHNVDAKGRVIIPAKWREELTGSVILAVLEGGKKVGSVGLQCMSREVWKAYVDSFDDIGRFDLERMGEVRYVLAHSADTEIDKQGRMLIPVEMRELVGIDGEVMMVGSRDRIEIWPMSSWTAYISGVEETRVERTDEINKFRGRA